MKHSPTILGLTAALCACKSSGTQPPPVPPEQRVPIHQLRERLEQKAHLRADSQPTDSPSSQPRDAPLYVAEQGWYVESGSRPLEQQFGRVAGEWRTRYADGSLRSEYSSRVDGQPSVMRFYYPSGKLQAEGPAVAGVKEGEWSYWHESGGLAKQGTYREGFAEGLWSYWDEVGGLRARGEMEQGARVGTWQFEEGPPLPPQPDPTSADE